MPLCETCLWIAGRVVLSQLVDQMWLQEGDLDPRIRRPGRDAKRMAGPRPWPTSESDSRAQRADGVHDDEAYGGALVVCYCITAALAYVAGILTVIGWQWLWR